MKLQIDYKKITAENTNTWRQNNMLLNNLWITEEIKEEIKNTQRQMKMKRPQPKTMGHSKISSKRKVYSDTSLPKETRKMCNLT